LFTFPAFSESPGIWLQRPKFGRTKFKKQKKLRTWVHYASLCP